MYLLKYYNLSDSDYEALSSSLRNSAIDLHTIVNESEIYDTTYQLYENSTAQGDMTTATLYAVELQRSYQNISHSTQNIKSNLTIAIVLSNNTYVELDENTLNDIGLTLDQFNQYSSRIGEKEKKIQELLGGANITLSCSAAETDIQEPITLTSNLVDRDNVPVSNAKIEFYANDRLAGTGTTDSNGTCVFHYVVPLDSKNQVIFYSKYIPWETDRLSVTSNEVGLRVLPENTTLSMSIEPDTAAYGDSINISGLLISENGVGVPSRSIGVYLNDSRVGSTATNNDGYYRYNFAISPGTPEGLCLLHSVYPGSYAGNDVFLSSSSNSSEIIVLTRSTVLTLNDPGTELDSGTGAVFFGSLLTQGGKPVGDETISIYAGDRLLDTAVTGSDGRYQNNITIPFDIASGTYPVYSRYSQEPGKALTGSTSGVFSVYLNTTPLMFTAVSSPVLLFVNDTMYVNGSISAGNGKPVGNKGLHVNMSNTTIGEVFTDANGSYVFSHTINSSDSMGLYNLEVILPASNLSAKITAPAGQVLIIPFDKVPVIVGIVLLIVVIGAIVLLQVNGFYSRIRIRRVDRPIASKHEEKVARKEPVEKTPVTKPVSEEIIVHEATVEEKPVAQHVPESKREFNLDETLKAVQSNISSGDMKGAIIQVYQISRQLAIAQGFSIPDSITHREFYRMVTSKYPILTTPLKSIINTYEKANYSSLPVTGPEATSALNSLMETHLYLTVNSIQEPGK